MEHVDINSDLQSLRKLYGHLRSLKISSQSSSSEYLDEKAQLLFKDLLDGASERIFGAYSEFMSAQLHVSELTPATQLENQKGITMLMSPGSPIHVSGTSGVSQNINRNLVTADGNKQNIMKPEAISFAPENSNLDYCNPKPVKRRRYCRIPCKIHIEKSKSRESKKGNSDKELKQLNESSPYHWSETQQQKIVLDDTTNVNDASNFDSSVSISGNEDLVKSEAGSNIGSKIEKKIEDTESILKQIASTINIIDSHILALKLAADPVITGQLAVNHTQSTQAQKVLSGHDDMETKQSVRSVSDYKDMTLVFHNVKPFISGTKVQSHMLDPMKSTETQSPSNNTNLREIIGKTMSTSLKNNRNVDQEGDLELNEPFIENQVSGRNVKAMVHKIESMSRLASQSEETKSDGCKYIRGMRVTESLSNVATVTPFPGQTIKEFSNPLLRRQNELNFGTSRSLMPDRIYHQFMASPILYGKGIGQGEERNQENKKSVASWKKISPHWLDLEEARSFSVASSSWTSQQVTTSGGNIEEYSLSDTQSNNYMGSSGSSYADSESDSFLSQTRGYENSSSSSGDRDVDLSESTDHQNADWDVDSQSISVGSVTNHRSGNSIKVKNQTGRFRKLKDKLGLIFHHHHHHHHHHHDHDDNVYDHRIKATRGRSLWKNAVKIFHSTGRTEKHREKAAEKVTRSLVQKVPKKNQNGHFHALVNGALRHAKNRKSLKLPKGDIKRIQMSHCGGKNGAQKLHWCQMLQQQRAVKMPSKPKVKLGLGTKEP